MGRCRTSTALRVVATATKSEQDVLACKGRVEKSRRKRRSERERVRAEERERAVLGRDRASLQSISEVDSYANINQK